MFNSIFRESDNAAARFKHQIDTLKIFNDNVTEVVKDEEYKVDFDTGGRTVSLVVKLGPDFPVEKPSLFIYPPVRHPWVSPTGEIVSAPGLLSYTIHSDLGRVVQAIIREFELRPPQLLNGDTSPPQPHTQLNQKPYFNCIYNDNNYNVPNSYDTTVSLSFPTLKDLSTAQLQDLNDNSQLLNSYIETLNIHSSINAKIGELIEQNEILALENMKREPELNHLKEELCSLHESLQEYKNRYEQLSSEYKQCCEKYNPHRIIERIRQSVAEIDEEGEKIAESFLTGELDLETFLVDYVNHRNISHSRKVKDDKLTQQLEKLHQAGY